MADPRFYDNHGPFALADIGARVGADLPEGANREARITDVASLAGAGSSHLSFFTGAGPVSQFTQSRAGFCFVAQSGHKAEVPPHMTTVPVASVQHAFAAAVELFYPNSSLPPWTQTLAIAPSAIIGTDVVLGPGVVIGPDVEIGHGAQIGPNTVIGRGVTIGRNCQIASGVTITHAYIGDDVMIFPGAQIGQPGFGFASSDSHHTRIPQIGRVIVQDKVEIGAATTIDRGAIGDTAIGEGTKIDNLVHIGHNTRIGRHCIILAQVGISGSCDIGDFVVLGGQVGLTDHVTIGNGARFIGRSGLMSGEYAGGRDYGGQPAVPAREWMRQVAAVKALAARKRKSE
ncbi:MAG TPA: UDP-3-O-(3-hydroxymyristoyl)glucosamine N-acyltransferase [Rhizomicrobium sp.]|nr:UDP-3-O-(3-hydroxymyristoyl)glucosamine N-acyltransferase [Rhizomicrobium sp.]